MIRAVFSFAQTNQLPSFSISWEHKTSYILDSFDLNNPDLRQNLLIIVITIGGFCALCYVTLLMKLKK